MYAFPTSAAGVAGANVFLSLFMPQTVSARLTVARVQVSTLAVAVTTAGNTLQLAKITAASGGALQAASSIFRYRRTFPAPSAELRITNPTITTENPAFFFPPPVLITAADAYPAGLYVWTPPVGFSCELEPGEGLALFQSGAGDVDQAYRISIDWSELFLPPSIFRP